VAPDCVHGGSDGNAVFFALFAGFIVGSLHDRGATELPGLDGVSPLLGSSYWSFLHHPDPSTLRFWQCNLVAQINQPFTDIRFSFASIYE